MSSSTYASALELAAGLVILCAVVTLWRRSLSAIVKALAVQGMALGAVALNQSSECFQRPVNGFLENPFSAPHDVRDLRG